MHAPSSFLSGFLRAARQTGWGSASSSAGGAPRRAASGTGGLGALARPRERRDGPRHRSPVGAAPPPGPSSGDRRGSAPPSLSPRASGSPGAGHDAQGPRPRSGLRWRRCTGRPVSRCLLAHPAPRPGTARGTSSGPRAAAAARGPAPCSEPPGLARLPPRCGAAVAPGPGQAAEAQGRQRWTPGRGVPAPSPVRTKPKRPRLRQRAGSPRRGQVPDGAAGPAEPRLAAAWCAHVSPRRAVPGAGLGAEFTARL